MQLLSARFYHNVISTPAAIPATIENVANSPHNHMKNLWQGLHGSSVGLAIATLAQERMQPILVVTKDLHTTAKLTAEIAFFFENTSDPLLLSTPLLNFPDWETLPYDHFSPHQDIISQRLATLYRLPSLQRGILISSMNTLLQRLPPRTHVEQNSFVLQCGDYLDIGLLRQRLEKQGYTCVNKVMEHGEFAVRGSLIDLFAIGSNDPLRIDLFDNQVDSIRVFDPETQLTTTKIDAINLLPAKEFPLTPDAIARFRQNWRACFSGDPTNCPIYQSISNAESAGGIQYYLPLFFAPVSISSCVENVEHAESIETENAVLTKSNAINANNTGLSSLCDYLPSNCLVIVVDDVYQSAVHLRKEIDGRYAELRHDLTRPILPPPLVFFSVDEVFAKLKPLPRIQVSTVASSGNNEFVAPLPDISIDNKSPQSLAKLSAFTADFPGSCLICAESKGRLESLLDILRTAKIYPQTCANWQDFLANLAANVSVDVDAATAVCKYYITVALLDKGFVVQQSEQNSTAISSLSFSLPSLPHNDAHGQLQLIDVPFALIAEADFFGQHVVQQRRYRKQTRQVDAQNIVRDLIELHPNSPVVHLEHGIGRYLGLQTITTDGVDAEFLTIEYANNTKLYVPIGSLHLISRYTGGNDPENIPYNNLGTDKWAKAKRKALEKIRDVAAELLGIYAQRAARPGFAFNLPEVDYHKFAALFPFEETPDQEQAIAAVINDMTAPRHMDRLICGDVGFGKTEVAMRATFIAVNNDKQVAVLVPTTILAQQHYTNFKDRFADWALNIELISRVRSAKEQSAILQQLKDGKIDIIIGTHRLLQPSIQFKDLGLLIIDEEHRFGVKQKERLKELRPEVDMLTLTATPIPRTLNMALAGMRDFSIIATPPARRLAIKTFIHERDNAVIREAIWREILRGGQVYFLHNDVATIEKTAEELTALIPSLRIATAHGQMRERHLEHVMTDFYHKRFNVLVCTTIIESGIDVPSANTIIIDRADRLGLAQLHQLRGRVGRSHHQAYAYLLVPSKRLLAKDAERRLEAITAMEDLGAGFNLATNDLEIRGAGELLGDEQSGHIESIGFSLYMEYLESAVQALKEGREIKIDNWEIATALRAEVEISKLPTLFPDEYIHDIGTRLTLYKRLANVRNMEEISMLKEEVIDRFGRLPAASQNLFRVAALKLIAEELGIRKITANDAGGLITFSAKPCIDPGKIINLIQLQPRYYRLRGNDKLAFSYKNNAVPPAIAPAITPVFMLDYLDSLLGELSA